MRFSPLVLESFQVDHGELVVTAFETGTQKFLGPRSQRSRTSPVLRYWTDPTLNVQGCGLHERFYLGVLALDYHSLGGTMQTPCLMCLETASYPNESGDDVFIVDMSKHISLCLMSINCQSSKLGGEVRLQNGPGSFQGSPSDLPFSLSSFRSNPWACVRTIK